MDQPGLCTEILSQMGFLGGHDVTENWKIVFILKMINEKMAMCQKVSSSKAGAAYKVVLVDWVGGFYISLTTIGLFNHAHLLL